MSKSTKSNESSEAAEGTAPIATVEPRMEKVRVRFTKEHIHAGITYLPDQVTEVEARFAERIVKFGTGEIITGAGLITTF